MPDFVLNLSRTFNSECPFNWDDAGKTHEIKIPCVFAILPQDVLVAKLEEQAKDPETPVSPYPTLNIVLESVDLSVFKGVKDANGKPLPKKLYKPAALNDPQLSLKLYQHYNQVIAGNFQAAI